MTSSPLSYDRSTHARRPLTTSLRLALAACLLAACQGDGASGTGPAGPATAQIALGARVESSGATAVMLRAFAQVNGQRVSLDSTTKALGPESTAVEFPIDLAPCLGDAAAGERACSVIVEISLLRDDIVLDRREIGPIRVAAGTTTAVPEAVALYEVSRIQLGALGALEPQDTVAVTATPVDTTGAPVATKSIEWASSNPAVLLASGLDATHVRLVAMSPGTAELRATIGTRTFLLPITVRPPSAASIALAPDAIRLSVGGTRQLTASVSDKRARPIAGAAVAYASADPTIATVSATGLVTGIARGETRIVASIGAVSDTAQVSVVAGPPAGITISPLTVPFEENDTLEVSAVVRDAQGVVVAGTVSWRSTAPQVATVASTGAQSARLVALAPSSSPVLIIASVEGDGSVPADTLGVTVQPASVARVAVQLNAQQIEVGENTRAAATAYDRHGNAIQRGVASWQSGTPSVATVDATGRVTGVAPGTAIISATVAGVRGEQSVTVVPATLDRVSISPHQSALGIGAQQQLVAAILDARGADLPAGGTVMQWTSLDPAIATVQNASVGSVVVVGVAVGTARIEARTTIAGVTRADTATITVSQTAAVTIQSITSGGSPVALSNVAGTITVSVGYTLSGATASGIELLVGTTVVATQALGGGGPCNPCALTVNTAQFDPTTGAVLLGNGPTPLSARLVLANAPPVATPPVALTLANTSGFVASVASTRSASNPSTGVWSGGDVTVTLLPVIYIPGETVTGVSLAPGLFGKSAISLVAGSGGFGATFAGATFWTPSNLGIGRYETPCGFYSPTCVEPAIAVGSSTLSGGGAGPTVILNAQAPFRVDEVAPAGPFVAAMPAWVSGSFTFATDAGVTVGSDNSVGGVSTTYYVGTSLSGGNGTCSTTGLSPVTTGAQLAESATTGAYVGRVIVQDALGNQQCADLAPGGTGSASFGVDLTPPSLTVNGPADNSTWIILGSVPNFSVGTSDNASGVPAQPLRVSISRLNGTGSTNCLIGTGGGCTPAPTGSSFSSNDGGQGYYSATISATDVAGNASAPVVTTYLLDASIPTLFGGIGLPAFISGTGSVSFTTTATDNIDLSQAVGTLSYTGTTVVMPTVTLGGFGPPLERNVPVSFTGTPWRCLDGASLSSFSVWVLDQTLLNGVTSNVVIPPASVAPCGAIGTTPGISFGALSSSNPTISAVGATGGTPTSTQLSIDVTVPIATVNAPFASVAFYSDYTSAGSLALEVSGSPSIIQTATTRTYRYTATWSPSRRVGTSPSVSAGIAAIATNGQGDAMTIGSSSVTIVP
jgi:hypothetical protein